MAPSLVLIPGASAAPELYASLLEEVRARNHDIQALHLPSVAHVPPPGPAPTMYDDAAHIRSHVAKLVEEGKDVVLTAHSYGGTPTTESVKGLSKREREAEGLSGGVVGIAYMTALVPELGQSAGDVAASKQEGEVVPSEVDENGWIFYPDIQAVAAVVCSDSPPEEGARLVRQLARHSGASFAGPLTHAGYGDVDVSYLKCLRDLSVTPEVQQAGIDMIERVTGRRVDVREVAADHVAPWSRVPLVADWLVGVAEKHSV